MGDDPHARPRSLASFLRAYRHYPSPPDEAIEAMIRLVAEGNGIPRDEAIWRRDMIDRTRAAVEHYIGREIGDDLTVRLFMGRLDVDFGIGPVDADRLIPIHLVCLLVHFARWKSATGPAVQDVLRPVAMLKRLEESTPTDPHSTPVFLKALAAFPAPDPEPTGANQPAASGIEARAETTIDPGAIGPSPPSEKAVQCYRLLILRGDKTTQATTARRVYGDAGKQSQVSRDVSRVKAWISAGNVLPLLEEDKPRTYTIDPSKLDKGPGQAGRGRR